MDRFLGWVLERRHRASVLVAVSLVLPLLSVLGGGLLVYVTLRRGVVEAGWVALFAAILLALLNVLGDSLAAAAGASIAAMISWLPILGLAAIQARYGGLSLTVQAGASVAALLLIGFWLVAADPAALSLQVLGPVFSMMEGAGIALDESARETIAESFPGLFLGFMLLGYLVSLFLGCYWATRGHEEGSYVRQFRRLRVGRLLAGVATAAMIAAAATGWLLPLNLVWLFAALLVLQGLAVAHFAVREAGAHVAVLYAVYGLLLLVSQVGVPLTVAVGYLDNWIDIRPRLAAYGRSKQE